MLAELLIHILFVLLWTDSILARCGISAIELYFPNIVCVRFGIQSFGATLARIGINVP
jgi:hypothetical protein